MYTNEPSVLVPHCQLDESLAKYAVGASVAVSVSVECHVGSHKPWSTMVVAASKKSALLSGSLLSESNVLIVVAVCSQVVDAPDLVPARISEVALFAA